MPSCSRVRDALIYGVATLAITGLAAGGRLLTARGAAAAFLVGWLVLISAGWAGGAVLLAFFIPASLVSRVTRPPEAGLDPKGEERGALQVLANGFAPAIGAALATLAGLPRLGWLMLVAGFAVAAADTWATALGSRSRRAPRHVVTGVTVARGASGGVTPLGIAGALVGAAAVGVAGSLDAAAQPMAAAIIIGLAGMFLDSLLGAVAQGRFYCEACQQPSEWLRHRCGSRTRHVGGIKWLSNDAVNAMATLAGTLAGAAWWVLLVL